MIEVSGSGLLPLCVVYALRATGLRAFLSDRWDPGFFRGWRGGNNLYDSGCVLLEGVSGSGLIRTESFEDLGIFDLHLRKSPVAAILRLSGAEITPVKVSSVHRNQVIPDFVIADRLDGINVLKLSTLSSVPEDLHPSNKHRNLLRVTSLSAASEQIYPASYSDWYCSILESWFPGAAAILPANFHRLIWAPLYWPESLVDPQFRTGERELSYFRTEESFAATLQKAAKQLMTDGNSPDQPGLSTAFQVDLENERVITLADQVRMQSVTLLGGSGLPPAVLHDLDRSGVFRVSVNLGSDNVVLVEARTDLKFPNLYERAYKILSLYARQQQTPAKITLSKEPIGSEHLAVRIPSLRDNRGLTSSCQLDTPAFKRQQEGLGRVIYKVNADPPFGSLNGQMLRGLQVASDIRESYFE